MRESQVLFPLFVASLGRQPVSVRAHGGTPTDGFPILRHAVLLRFERRERGHAKLRVAEVSQALVCGLMRQR